MGKYIKEDTREYDQMVDFHGTTMTIEELEVTLELSGMKSKGRTTIEATTLSNPKDDNKIMKLTTSS